MNIEHETHPCIALRIMRSGTFRGGPIAGDAGLNACGSGGVGFHPEQAASKGAILQFEWQGPVATGYPAHFPQKNILYDQRPHRLFIPVGTDEGLFLTSIRLLNGYSWADCVIPASWPTGWALLCPVAWIHAALSRNKAGLSNQADEIAAEAALLLQKPVKISIQPHIDDWYR